MQFESSPASERRGNFVNFTMEVANETAAEFRSTGPSLVRGGLEKPSHAIADQPDWR